MLAGRGVGMLDLLAVTNYDEDHVSGYRNLRDNVGVAALARNGTVSARAIQQLKTEDGMGPGIAALVSSIEHYFTGPAPVFDFGDLVKSRELEPLGKAVLKKFAR